MSKPTLFLMPGQLYFGGDYQCLRTILGSCVALTLWHPASGVGGMCHFALPSRVRKAGAAPDGRYGEEAVMLLRQLLMDHGIQPQEVSVGLFGGGDMFEAAQIERVGSLTIGARNIEAARRETARHGFRIEREDVGGRFYRRIALDIACGAVKLHKGAVKLPQSNPRAARVGG